MKSILLYLLFLPLFVIGQTAIQTKEVEIVYTNGLEKFRICTSGCTRTFDDNKFYFWYTEFSKIKSTKGASGGSLLHGNYKFYDEYGNLRIDRNYYLGLRDGNEKHWDSLGNIIEIVKWSKDSITYNKLRNDEGNWVEHYGTLLENGWVKKVYTNTDDLINETKTISTSSDTYHCREFYTTGENKIKKDFYTGALWLLDGYGIKGKYTLYYENGNVKVAGEFYNGDRTNVKVGTWYYYNSDGSLESTQQFNVSVEKWSNGNYKIIGGLFLDTETNVWVKDGDWTWWTEDGKLQTRKYYKLGVESEIPSGWKR
jgi:antitoxin component YwqK of YwqJK toxin-antitoxin module